MKKYAILIIILLLIIYSAFIEPNRLTVTNYKLKDKDLAGLKIVMAGDLHVKQYQSKRLDKIVETINAQNPDLILLVGDYVSGHNETFTLPIDQIAHQLGNLKAKHGVYSVLGNHDWWANGNKIIKELEKNNIKVLANSNKVLNINNMPVTIAGVEDLTTRMTDVYEAITGAKGGTILLTHSPDVFTEVNTENHRVNLPLAGHVHGGQVRLPFIGAILIPSEYGNRYAQGLIVENNSKMIVTRGIGTSILPIRFNCAPEIVVIEFEKE